MNKKNYVAGIFFSGLCLIIILFRCSLHLKIERQVFFRQSFGQWMIVSSIVESVWLLLLVKYYRCKKYMLASGTMLFVIITFISGSVVSYIFFTTTENEFLGFVQYSQVILSAALAMHFTSLIFLRARENQWLKAAGITGICVILVQWWIRLWKPDLVNLHYMLKWERIREWAILLDSVLPVFFIMNFISEIRLLQPEPEKMKTRGKYLIGVWTTMILLVIFISGLTLATKKQVAAHTLSAVTDNERAAAHFFEARYYINKSGDTMRYRLMKPLDYDLKRKYPIVVCLHHGGGWGTDNIKQIAASPSARLSEGLALFTQFFA